MAFFDWLEQSAFSMWVKDPDTLFGYDMLLSAHAIGMAMVVGLSSATALRILGFAPRVPLAPMARFFPLMFAGFWIAVFSGLVLFVIYPVKPVGNPGFYLKVGFVLAAAACIRRIRRDVFGNPSYQGTSPVGVPGKRLAVVLLLLWIGILTAGRLMAYRGIANVEWQVSIAMAVVVPVMFFGGWLAYRRQRLNASNVVG